MAAPQIHIFRHHNPILVDQFMEHFQSDLDPKKNLSYQTSINPQYLKVMRALADMRETADRSNMGFFGGFITPEGYHYSISNIDPNNLIDSRYQLPIENFIRIDENFKINEIYKKMKIVSTAEGIQLRLTDES